MSVVLGGGEQDVYAGLFHQPVELGSVKRDSRSLGRTLGALHSDCPFKNLAHDPNAIPSLGP